MCRNERFPNYPLGPAWENVFAAAPEFPKLVPTDDNLHGSPS